MGSEGSGGSVRGRVLALLGDGAPRSTSEIAVQLGLDAGSVLWACYDLFRFGRVLKSEGSSGTLGVERDGVARRFGDFSFLTAPDGVNEVVVQKVRYLRHTENGSSAHLNGGGYETCQGRVMRLLLDQTPRSTKQIASQLGLTQERTYNALFELFEKGALLRTEKPHVPASQKKWQRQARYHLWTVRLREEKERHVNGEKYRVYGKRNGRSLSKTILEYVKTRLRDRATFSTELKKELEQEWGKPISQTMIMCTLRRRRDPEVYIGGYQGPTRMTAFERGFAVTWINPNLPRIEALKQAQARTDQLVRCEATSSPLFQRVHITYDLATRLSLKRDITSSIQIMSELGCTRHQLELTLRKTMEFYSSIKRLSIFGDDQGNYGYVHLYNSEVLAPDDLQAAVKAKEQYIMKVKSSDERKGHALEGVAWWALERFKGARFETQQHRTEGMHPNRHTLHLTRPVRRRKHNAEIDGYWKSREPGLLSNNEHIRNVLEIKFSLISPKDLEDFVDVVKYSDEFGVDAKDGRIIQNGVVLWMVGAAIDNKAHIRVGNEYLTVATYAGRLGIKFIPISQINDQLRKRGWEKASVKAICKIAKDANEAMTVLDEVWKHPKNAQKILERYREQNKAILEQERLLEERMAKRRQSKTILDENEENPEEGKVGKIDVAAL